jgi:hypothetical protein
MNSRSSILVRQCFLPTPPAHNRLCSLLSLTQWAWSQLFPPRVKVNNARRCISNTHDTATSPSHNRQKISVPSLLFLLLRFLETVTKNKWNSNKSHRDRNCFLAITQFTYLFRYKPFDRTTATTTSNICTPTSRGLWGWFGHSTRARHRTKFEPFFILDNKSSSTMRCQKTVHFFGFVHSVLTISPFNRKLKINVTHNAPTLQAVSFLQNPSRSNKPPHFMTLLHYHVHANGESNGTSWIQSTPSHQIYLKIIYPST